MEASNVLSKPTFYGQFMRVKASIELPFDHFAPIK